MPQRKTFKNRKSRRLKSIRISKEIQILWNLKKIDVIPVVLEALWSVTKNFKKYVDKIGLKMGLHTAQKATLLGTARITKKVLEC